MPRQPISWDGMTEGEALDLVLCPEGRTDDQTADLVSAFLKLEQIDSAAVVILHALHAELGSWKRVAKRLGRPQTTIWNRAHRKMLS